MCIITHGVRWTELPTAKGIQAWTGVLCHWENFSSYTECMGWISEHLTSTMHWGWWKILKQQSPEFKKTKTHLFWNKKAVQFLQRMTLPASKKDSFSTVVLNGSNRISSASALFIKYYQHSPKRNCSAMQPVPVPIPTEGIPVKHQYQNAQPAHFLKCCM